MKMVTMLIWVAETWNEVNKIGMQWSMGKKMMKEEMEKQQCDSMLFLAESIVKKQRENIEENGNT